MARIIEDAGATAAILKPLALPVFEPDRLIAANAVASVSVSKTEAA